MSVKDHEDYLFKIVKRTLEWAEAKATPEEVAYLVMSELLDIPLPK